MSTQRALRFATVTSRTSTKKLTEHRLPHSLSFYSPCLGSSGKEKNQVLDIIKLNKGNRCQSQQVAQKGFHLRDLRWEGAKFHVGTVINHRAKASGRGHCLVTINLGPPAAWTHAA